MPAFQLAKPIQSADQFCLLHLLSKINFLIVPFIPNRKSTKLEIYDILEAQKTVSVDGRCSSISCLDSNLTKSSLDRRMS